MDLGNCGNWELKVKRILRKIERFENNISDISEKLLRNHEINVLLM